jgi:hypothetical protein
MIVHHDGLVHHDHFGDGHGGELDWESHGTESHGNSPEAELLLSYPLPVSENFDFSVFSTSLDWSNGESTSSGDSPSVADPLTGLELGESSSTANDPLSEAGLEAAPPETDPAEPMPVLPPDWFVTAVGHPTEAEFAPALSEADPSGTVEVTAQEFLDSFDEGFIPEGVTVKVTDDTQGSFAGDFNVDVYGELQFGGGISIDVGGLFQIDESYAGSHLQFSDNVSFSAGQLQWWLNDDLQLEERTAITAGSIEWLVNGNVQVKTGSPILAVDAMTLQAEGLVQLEDSAQITAGSMDWFSNGGIQVKMDSALATTEGNLALKSTGAVQLEEDSWLQAAGSLNIETRVDGSVQIKKVESEVLAAPNLKAGGDITIKSIGDIQIGDGNILEAGGSLWLEGTSDEGDIEIGPPPETADFSLKAGKDLYMETNGDIQIQEGNILYAGHDLTLIANSEGDVQIQQVDTPLATPRVEAGHDIYIAAEGDINIQRGDAIGAQPYPDLKAGHDLVMQGMGEVEVEPGNWLYAGHTLHLETDGVEVQVQPRAEVILEAGQNIELVAPEENAGVKVGENSTLRAGQDIIITSGWHDQGEGDTQVKEGSTLNAGANIWIESGLSGSTEVKEDSTLMAANSITIQAGDHGQTVVKGNNYLRATNSITIASGDEGETVVTGDGTQLVAADVTIKTGLEGDVVIEPDAVIVSSLAAESSLA